MTPEVAITAWGIRVGRLAEGDRSMRGVRGHLLSAAAFSLATVADEVLAARRSAPLPEVGSDFDVRLGTSHGSRVSDLEFLESLAARGDALGSPSAFVQTLSTSALSELSIRLCFRGAVVTFSGGEVAGLLSVAQSAGLIALGRSSAILCGAIDVSGCDSDVVALFLLEQARSDTSAPRLARWTVGFDPAAHPCPTTLRSSLERLVLALDGSGGAVAGASVGGEFVRLDIDPGDGRSAQSAEREGV